MRAVAPTLVPVKVWKWIGLAGVFGIASGGVVIARQERVRRAYSPDEVRSRLHQRYAEATASDR